jgi:uroporphyrinogen-III decarboxylase
MSFFMNDKIDFVRHNAEVAKLMKEFHELKHERVPVVIGGSIRNLISNPEVNSTGYSFKDFFTKAEAQVKCQLEYKYYMMHNIICDREMGLPEKGWQLSLDFQNSHDQSWFGCPFIFFGDTDVPDTVEILKGNPELLYGWEDPDPFYGRGDFMLKAMEMYQEMNEICRKGLEFHGKPVFPPIAFPSLGTDGLFDVALKLRGAVELMTDMYENPKYFHDLMDYVTRNTIVRMKAHRKWAWDNDPDYKGNRLYRGLFSYADDSIAMLSTEQFKEFILPYTKRLFDEFHDGNGCRIHLCGNATHHFKFLADEFNVKSFDTGFPVDHGWLRKQLGPEIEISGGPTIMLVKNGTPGQIDAEVKRICESGVLEGGRFILIAANNLAPCTPVENIKALYEAGKKYGRTQ